MKKTNIIDLRGMCAAICFAGVLAGCSAEAPEETSQPIRPAKLVTISTSSDIRSVDFPAVIAADASSQLTFQVGGLVQSIAVHEGQRVEKGTVIASLDPETFENNVATAQAQFDNADAEFQRADRLITEGAIARSTYDQRKAQKDVTRAALDNMLKSLEDAVLVAPFSGVISVVHAKQFQNVQPLEAIATLQSVGDAEAVVQIPASLVANSNQFETLETVIVLDAASGIRVPAVLISSTTEADPTTQTFEVRFSFTPPESLIILPGMTGTIHSRIEMEREDGAADQITVPLGAVLSDGETQYVWLVDEGTMTVSRRDIVVGAGVGESLAVVSGLVGGDVIVGAGASYLHEGMQIRRYEQ